MLNSLSIRDVVLIEKLDLEFDGGLNVFTGETGAGKSILLDSLSLALGTRAETALVRKGAKQLSVCAEFTLPEKHPVFNLLEEQGIDFDEDLIHGIGIKRKEKEREKLALEAVEEAYKKQEEKYYLPAYR